MVRYSTRAQYFFQEETVDEIVGTVPHPFAATQFDGHNREMNLVDEIGIEKLAQRGDATAEAHVFAFGRLKGLRQCVLRRRINKMKRRVPQGDGGAHVMREYKHRRMERRVVAPPPFPVIVLPRSALGAKFIAPHDFGTDVPSEVASAVVVKTVRSAGIGSVDPVCGRSRPGKEIGRICVTEWVLETLAHTGAVAIARHHEILHSDCLRHRGAFLATNSDGTADAHVTFRYLPRPLTAQSI